MPENPIYDPNKIVKRAYTRDSYTSGPEEQSSNGVPKYDASKIVKRGYAPREDFQEEGFSPEKYTAQGVGEVDDSAEESDREVLLDYMIKNIPEGGSIRDDEKDILRGILKNPNATRDDMFNAIKTFKGVHPEQVYNRRGPIRTTKEYYMDMDDKGIYKPVPIGQFKPLPAGKNIASVWGTGAEAQDDSWYTDLAKKAFNIIPSSIEGIETLISAVSPELRKIGAKLEGKKYEKSEPTKAAEESAKFIQQFKFPTSEEYNQQIYDAEGVKNFEDLISKDRVNLSLKNVYGTVSSLAGSVGEMLLTGGAAAEGMLATKAAMASKVKGVAPALTKAQKYASVYTGSFISNLGDGMDAAKKAGISEEDAGSFALAVTTPIAFLDAGLGIGGKILSNKLANEGKKELLENIASRVVKDEFGNITEESLKKASSEAVKAYTPVAKSISKLKLGLKDVLEQGSEEALQSFISSAGEQLYDKLSDADKVKFGTDAFSAESFGKYISEGIAGLVGSGPLAVKTAKAKQQELYKAQSNSAYDIVMQGEDAIKAFKTNATNAFEKGEISKEDYDNAIVKIDAYDSYEKTTKDLTLDNDNKKKLFELSLQKENLKAAIKDAEAKDTEGHSRLDKMNPAELGLHNSKVKQAKALQDEIDLIVTKSEVLQQPEVAEKVVDKVVKAEEKATEGIKVKEGVSSEIGAILGRQYKVKAPIGGEVAVPGKAAYEVPKKVLEEKRKMKDFSTQEWNIANPTVKQAKLADALEETPEKTTIGTLQEDNKYYDDKKGLWVQTYNLTLPNGKTAQFASSMVRFPEEGSIGGFRGNTYEENLTDRKNPIGQKLGATVRTLKDSGRKVIFIWNADEGPKYGKHIGMVREDPEGKSVYGAADLDEMADLRMINMGQNPNAPAPGIFTPKEPTKGGAPKVVVPVKNKEVRDKLKVLGYSKPEIQAMEPKEANDIVKEQKEKPKAKKQPLEEVEIKDKKATAKKEQKVASLRAQEQAELKREIPNIADYSDTYGEKQGSMPNNLYAIYKPIYDKYNKLITDLSESKPTTSAKSDLEALKQTPEGKKIEEEREKTLKSVSASASQMMVYVPSGDNRKLTNEEQEEVENFIEQLIKKGKTAQEIINYLKKQNFVRTISVSPEDQISYIQGRIDGTITTPVNSYSIIKDINAKYDAELAALESKPAEEKSKIKVKKAPKEVVVKKEESIAKRKALMDSILGASKLIAAYNNLTKSQKKSETGVNLYKKIQDRVKEINYTTTISRGGTLQLVGEKGKRVYKNPVKRTEDQKAIEAEKKDALRAEPTSIAHAVILDIANGAQFNVDSLADYFSEKILKNEMPSLLKNNKKGIRVGSYKTNYEEAFGQFEIENITEADAAEEAARTLGDYFMNGFREAAIQDAIDINFKTKNEGRSRSEVEALNEMQKEQEREEKELEDILAQEDLEKEEYRRQAEQEEGYLQKAKVKPATLNKFEQSVDLFYQTKDADGASKKRGLAAKRREFLEKNPTVKYIDDNMKYIYKQLEEQNIIERKGECP